MTQYSRIALKKIELDVNLGWSVDERIKKQRVLIDLDITFLKPPRACLTDKLEDTFCYDQIIKLMNSSISSRKFHLIEHLTHELYNVVKATFPPHTKLNIRLTKNLTAVNLSGEAIFCFGDES